MQAIFMILLTVCSLFASEPLNLGKVLPYIVKCRVNMKNLETCIQDSIHSMRRILSRGVPLLEIEPLGSYHIRHYKVNLTKPFRGFIKFDGMSIDGLTNYQINGVRVTANVSHINFTALFPKITTTAAYKMNGTLDDIIIEKQGNMTGILNKTEAVIRMHGVFNIPYELPKYYFKVRTVTVSLKIKNITLNFNNLTDNVKDNIQNQTTKQDFRHYDWRVIFPEMMSQLELIAADFIKSTANKIYSKFPITKLLFN